MKNLKRALSLVLSAAMMVGMMVVGTGAAHADVTAEHNEEAIGVVSMVGIMGANKEFNPDAKITRNEMAVVMVNMLGLDTKDYAGASNFTDVPAWAADYVDACYANKIVSGVSATEFNGGANVTTAEAALMVMKALGYFQYAADFENDWMLATIKQASKIDLLDGIAAKANAAMTRNEVAQLVLNALESPVQTCSVSGNNTQITAGDVSITIDVTTSYSDDTNAIHYVTGDTTDTKAYLCETLFEGDLTKNTGAIDNMGRPAVEWTYDKAGQDAVTVKATKDADLTYIITKGDMNTLNEIVTEDELKVDSSATVCFSNDTSLNTTYALGKDTELAYGAVVECFKGSDKEIEKFVAYVYSIAEITKVEAYDNEETMAKDYEATVKYTVKDLAGTELTGKVYVDNLKEAKAGYQEIGTYAKGDVLAIVMKTDGTMLTKAIAKSVDGVKTAYGDGYIKLDGAKYTLLDGAPVAANYTDTWTYYMDPNGTIIDGELKEAAEAALTHVYLINKDAQDKDANLLGSKDNKAVVKVMYLDGTVETVEYALTKVTATAGVAGQVISSGSYTAGTIAKDKYYYTFNGTKYEYSEAMFEATVTGTWFGYTKNDAGQITLKSADKADVAKVETGITVLDDAQALKSGLYATSKTVVTVLDKDGIAKTYTGYKNFPAAGGTGSISSVEALIIYGAKTTEAAQVFVYDNASAGYSANAEKVEAAMYVSTGDVVEDGVVATFYVNGAKKEFVVTNDITALVAGQLVELTKDTDGNVSASTLTEGTDYTVGKIDVVSDDYIVLDGAIVELAKDCETFLVNAENKVMGEAELAVDATRYVAVFENTDGAYLVIIYKAMPSAVQ